MATRERLYHNINKLKGFRKINHPCMDSDWDNLDREEQKNRMLIWKIKKNN